MKPLACLRHACVIVHTQSAGHDRVTLKGVHTLMTGSGSSTALGMKKNACAEVDRNVGTEASACTP